MPSVALVIIHVDKYQSLSYGGIDFQQVPTKLPSFIPKPKAPMGLLEMAKAMYQTLMFFIKTLAILSM
jgi:hypothetical protein